MSLKTSLAGAATAIGLAALAYPAQAALYNFTYTHGGPTTPITVSGKVTGTVNLAGTELTVASFSDLKYNNVLVPNIDTVDSLTNWINIDGSLATFGLQTPSFTGTNIVFYNSNDINQFFSFGPYTDGVTPGLAFTSLGFDPETGDEQPFVGFTVAVVPEPGAVVALLGLGLGALASKIRKQA